MSLIFVSLMHFYLTSKVSERKRRKVRQVFYPLVYFPNAHSSQGSTRLKSEAGDSVWVPHEGGLDS